MVQGCQKCDHAGHYKRDAPRWMELHSHLTLIYLPWEALIRFSEVLSSQKKTRYSEELSSLGLSTGQPLFIADHQQHKTLPCKENPKQAPPETGSLAWRRNARTSAEAPAAHLGMQAQTLWRNRGMRQQLPQPISRPLVSTR